MAQALVLAEPALVPALAAARSPSVGMSADAALRACATSGAATLARLMAERKVIPQIAVVLSWCEFRRGFEALAARKVHGKVVYRVD